MRMTITALRRQFEKGGSTLILCWRSFVKYLTYVGLFEAVSAYTFARDARSALTTKIFRPCALRMVLAHPADAEETLQFGSIMR